MLRVTTQHRTRTPAATVGGVGSPGVDDRLASHPRTPCFAGSTGRGSHPRSAEHRLRARPSDERIVARHVEPSTPFPQPPDACLVIGRERPPSRPRDRAARAELLAPMPGQSTASSKDEADERNPSGSPRDVPRETSLVPAVPDSSTGSRGGQNSGRLAGTPTRRGSRVGAGSTSSSTARCTTAPPGRSTVRPSGP